MTKKKKTSEMLRTSVREINKWISESFFLYFRIVLIQYSYSWICSKHFIKSGKLFINSSMIRIWIILLVPDSKIQEYLHINYDCQWHLIDLKKNWRGLMRQTISFKFLIIGMWHTCASTEPITIEVGCIFLHNQYKLFMYFSW
jgi:hypothetical protein